MKEEPRISSERYVVLIVSNEPWGSQWFVKHHYASELADLGFEVYFLNPVGAWNIKRLLVQSVKVTRIRDRLWVAEYTNSLPVRLLPLVAVRLNDWINARKLRRLARGKRILVWQFDPFRFAHNCFRDGSRKIYHVADHYADLPFDMVSAQNADLIVCTSEQFMARYSALGLPLLHVPHAISAADRTFDPQVVADLRNRYGRYVLYAGSLNDRTDLRIFREVCREFPAHNLVVVGPNRLNKSEGRRLFEECRGYPNFIHEGTVDAAALRDYVCASEACLVAYRFDERQTLGPITSSLKVLHYLAQGKPIVSSSEIEYPDLQGRAIFFAPDLGTYLATLRAVLTGGAPVDHSVVEKFIAGHTYVGFIRDILAALGEGGADPSRAVAGRVPAPRRSGG